METREYEQEFERRLLNLLKGYGSYKLIGRKLKALEEEPASYVQTGALLIPGARPDQECNALQLAQRKLWVSMREQSENLAEPLQGILPDVIPYDLTYTPKTVTEILSAVGEFVNAAAVDNSIEITDPYNLYEGDEDRF